MFFCHHFWKKNKFVLGSSALLVIFVVINCAAASAETAVITKKSKSKSGNFMIKIDSHSQVGDIWCYVAEEKLCGKVVKSGEDYAILRMQKKAFLNLKKGYELEKDTKSPGPDGRGDLKAEPLAESDAGHEAKNGETEKENTGISVSGLVFSRIATSFNENLSNQPSDEQGSGLPSFVYSSKQNYSAIAVGVAKDNLYKIWLGVDTLPPYINESPGELTNEDVATRFAFAFVDAYVAEDFTISFGFRELDPVENSIGLLGKAGKDNASIYGVWLESKSQISYLSFNVETIAEVEERKYKRTNNTFYYQYAFAVSSSLKIIPYFKILQYGSHEVKLPIEGFDGESSIRGATSIIAGLCFSRGLSFSEVNYEKAPTNTLGLEDGYDEIFEFLHNENIQFDTLFLVLSAYMHKTIFNRAQEVYHANDEGILTNEQGIQTNEVKEFSAGIMPMYLITDYIQAGIGFNQFGVNNHLGSLISGGSIISPMIRFATQKNFKFGASLYLAYNIGNYNFKVKENYNGELINQLNTIQLGVHVFDWY